jgi:hypothetical protein
VATEGDSLTRIAGEKDGWHGSLARIDRFWIAAVFLRRCEIRYVFQFRRRS